ncbi:MAG: RNA-binding transcriptional accessory protein [Gammaproteobacteria bacterium]|nr:MAG: RNA-binding transcriptional accessory protein [Gammaproteobacteria bacterium]
MTRSIPPVASLQSRLSSSVGAADHQIEAAVALLDEGATVPFIARYRKEATGGLSDTQLRSLEERLGYFRELDQRRESIIAAIDEQGKLDPALHARLNAADTKAALEDLYLPYRKKRRTKGQMAIEAGLEPLADSLWNDGGAEPEALASKYIDAEKGYADTKAVLEGARYILMERFAEDAVLIGRLRELLQNDGHVVARVISGKEEEGARFRDYFDHAESLKHIPSHRALALFRARKEGVVSLALQMPEGDDHGDSACVDTVARHLGFRRSGAPADDWREQVVAWTWKVKLSTHLESELLSELKARADEAAIGVFAANLKDLLLAAPAGPRATLGLDPGYRTGVKVVVVDATGKVLEHTAIFPHQPQKQWRESLVTLAGLCNRHGVELIAIGNGTASRETEKLADELCRALPKPAPQKVVVSEAGASVYSASAQAESEFPNLDVTVRGAISIARRLQDPLAELVKIDPKAIGVGQYQHDVSQPALARSLDATVEDCVNAVGVNLDTASASLLKRVSGLSTTLAENIVSYREENGAFPSRAALRKVPRLGPKAFEQAAGFLRIPNGRNPLDASGVHPEAYPVVKAIEAHTGKSVSELIGDTATLRSLDAAQFTGEQFGLPTVRDIIAELEKPGRDPRPEFRTVAFADGVEKVADVVPGQVLEGQVTNVTDFGAFVDIGVHQDGLVHISAMSHQFVKEPRDVVRTGDIVKVKVMSVDEARGRIGLSMRLDDEPDADGQGESSRGGRRNGTGGARRSEGVSGNRGRGSGDHRQARQRGRDHGRSRGRAPGNPRQTETPSAFAESLKAALDRK